MFANAKTKTQISFAVTAKLISAYVFATQIVQSLYLLNSKFQASSPVLWLYSPVCLCAGRRPRRPVFLRRGSYLSSSRNAKVRNKTKRFKKKLPEAIPLFSNHDLPLSCEFKYLPLANENNTSRSKQRKTKI